MIVDLARVRCDRCGDQTPVYPDREAARIGAAQAWGWVSSMGADLCPTCQRAIHQPEGDGS